MHTVRARALQSVVAAPAHGRAGSRHTASRRTPARTAAPGTVRGFRSSAPCFVQPDESNAVHNKSDSPGPKDGAGAGEGAADAPPAAQEPEAAPASDTGSAADVPAATADTAVSPPAAATAPATAAGSAYVGGRSRAIRTRSTDSTPSFTLPEWFARHHVRSYENYDKADNTFLSTSLGQDLEAASLRMYPRSGLRFSTEPQARPLLPIPYDKSSPHIVQLEGSDRLQIQDYFSALLQGSGWTDHKVKLAAEQMRAGTGLDAIARRGAAVAAAAVYLTVAIAYRGPYPVADNTREHNNNNDDALFTLDSAHAPSETAKETSPPGSAVPSETAPSYTPSSSKSTVDSVDSTVDDTSPSETASADGQIPVAAKAEHQEESQEAKSGEEAASQAADAAAAESGETSDSVFNAELLSRLDPHGVLDLPQTPFSSVLVEYIRLTMPNASKPFLAAEADASATWGIPISTKSFERAMFREIQATVATELRAPPPDSKTVRRDWRRPVSVVTIMNYRGQAKAEALMNEVALTLSARIVHVDAKTIASVAGPYLGQTPLLSRGSVAMLGYTTARINGRLLPRYPKLPQSASKQAEGDEALSDYAAEDEEDDEYVYSRDGEAGSDNSGSSGDISVSLARMPMDLVSTTRSALRSDAEDRWDDLKMNHVIDAIVRSADAGAAPSSPSKPPTPSSRKPPLIIHVHNFIELSSAFDSNQILYKLRSVVDRLWQKERRRIVLVGSTSSHMKSEPGLVDRAEELRQEDCNIIPFQMQLDHYQYKRQATRSEELEVYHDNMHNICAMVTALTGSKVQARDIPWLDELFYADRNANSPGVLVDSLSPAVYDIHWVYRLATLWAGIAKGNPGTAFVDLLDGDLAEVAGQILVTAPPASAGAASPSDFSKTSFIHALWAAERLDKLWCEQGGAMGPYSSPLLIKRYRKAKKEKAIPWWWIKTLESKKDIARLEDEIKDFDDDDDFGVVPSRDSVEKKAAAGASTTRTGDNGGGGGGAGAGGSGKGGKSGKKPNYDAHNFSKYEQRFVNDIVDPADLTTTFDSIVLPAETTDSIKALTSLSLIRPEAFRYGVLATEHIPGCLLYGPPGTGKTLLAKAVAKQSGAKMLEISAASINDMWIGETEKNVRAVFSVARALAPIVVFIDEADALLAARHEHPGRNGQREMINQFLREWDGLSTSKSGKGAKSTDRDGKDGKDGKDDGKDDGKVFIMVATNRPGDLDEAVLRRLPRRILVDLPLRDARLAILRVMLRAEQLDEATVSLEKLADDTDLYSGSDLKNLCVAAAMQAVREEVAAMEAHTGAEPYAFPEKRVLTGKHFERAMQEIGASISEDMASLQAIRRFDDRYGDHGSKKRKKRRGMGFEVVPKRHGTKEAMVRQA